MTKTMLISAALLMSQAVMADAGSIGDWRQTLSDIQHQWARVNYETEGDAKEKAFEALSKQGDDFVAANPDIAQSHIWNGIIKSSFAGAKGGLGALGLAKQAKAEFETAIEIDDKALAGSAYTSLATLYSKVPGWPIGFGSDKKAKQMFQRSLEINPDGIDINYFYGEFLYDEKEYKQAREYLVKAQQAPKRPDRPKADMFRQQEIATLLAKVDKKLKR